MILSNHKAMVKVSNNIVVEENNTFKIINIPDFFDEEYLHPDQQIIDFMATSHPGPDLFILAIDSENTEEDRVRVQIDKIVETFGKEVTEHLVVTLPDIESFHSLGHLKKLFNIKLVIANEHLASECKKWCDGRQSFLYEYKNYSQDVVLKRKNALGNRR